MYSCEFWELFNKLLNLVKQSVSETSSTESTSAKAVSGETKTFTFEAIPKTVEELKALPGGDLKDPFATAAFLVVALNNYSVSADATVAMLDYLNGPESVTPYDRQFLKDRFTDGDYVIRSFFEGATPENDYKPSEPFTVKVSSNSYSDKSEGYKTLWIKSGGADAARSVTLRNKPSTGEWFISNYLLFGQIRKPRSLDQWA